MKSKNLSDFMENTFLREILSLVENYLNKRGCVQSNHVYDNKALMELLNIKDKYLKKLRDMGYLSYSREGEKYWYTQKDVDRFLERFHYRDFTDSPHLPPV